jgi:hypothetical protein
MCDKFAVRGNQSPEARAAEFKKGQELFDEAEQRKKDKDYMKFMDDICTR